jgi:hypothetical protein
MCRLEDKMRLQHCIKIVVTVCVTAQLLVTFMLLFTGSANPVQLVSIL